MTMNKILFVFVFFLSTGLMAYSQDSTSYQIRTIGGTKPSVGGFGGISAGYTMLEDRDAIYVGARGAALFGHCIAVGLAGQAFVNSYLYDADIDERINLVGGYGGLYVEPILFPRFPVHVSFPIVGGVGAVTRTFMVEDEDLTIENMPGTNEVFFVGEAGVAVDFNVTRFFRLAFEGTYRLTSSVDLGNSVSRDLNGFTAGVALKFGKF